jgi:methionine synthase II (cobalamin-independent)
MQAVRRGSRFFLWVLIIGSPLLWGCSKNEAIERREEQAIQMVKAYKANDKSFSVVSNIDKEASDSARAGDKWEMGTWEAGLPSQKELMLERLSQFFNVFRPTGDFWVRFSYKNKDGTYTGEWVVNLYSKKVEAVNDVAKRFSAAVESSES